MRRVILSILFLLICNISSAAIITIDTSGWTQDEKNLVQAAVCNMLYTQGITYNEQTFKVNLPNITIDNPSGDISFLTSASIKTKIDGLEVIIAQNTLLAKQEQDKKGAELAISELREIKIDDIDAKIDAISNLAEAKAFLKKLTRYLIARGI